MAQYQIMFEKNIVREMLMFGNVFDIVLKNIFEVDANNILMIWTEERKCIFKYYSCNSFCNEFGEFVYN